MKIKTMLGLALIVIGATVVSFGHWVNRIYYYAGFACLLVGVALSFSAYRARKDEIGSSGSENDPGIPVIAAREYFESPMTGGLKMLPETKHCRLTGKD